MWTLDLDDFQNICCRGSQPLLRTIAKELLGISYDPNAVNCTPPVVPKPSVEITTTTRRPDQGQGITKYSTLHIDKIVIHKHYAQVCVILKFLRGWRNDQAND